MKTIVVLAGGPSSEREVSLWTAKAMTDSLLRQGIPYQQIDPRAADWLEVVKKISPNVVLLALHGTFGEDGQIQKILEREGIAFTGSGAKSAELAFNKAKTKEKVQTLGIKTPTWQFAGSHPQVTPPVVIKPNREGSSYGITIVRNPEQLEPAIVTAQGYDEQVLIEEYIAGTEVTCGVTNLFEETQALPLVEIRPATEFFDFKAKYDGRYCQEICPAEIDLELTKVIQNQSLQIFQALDIDQYARIDWLIRDRQPYFLEINTLPGLTPTSLLPKELAAANITFDDFIQALLANASKIRHKKTETR